jgi:hypothetical protein
MPAKKKNKLDMFRVLDALDQCDFEFYSRLSPEDKEGFEPWLTMRWASSTLTYPDHYIMMVNEFVNVDFSAFKNHPEMQWKLMALCGAGRKLPKYKGHKWIPVPKKKKTKSGLASHISRLKPHFKDDEVKLFIEVNSEEEIADYFRDAGYDDKEIKEILNGS